MGAPTDTYGFAYDQAGERVLRYRVGSTGKVEETRFSLRDESGNVLTEYLWTPYFWADDDSAMGTWTRTADYVHLGRRPITRMIRNGPTETAYTSLVTDHLHSTRAEVLDAAAASANPIDYWPYGELATTTWPAGPLTEHRLFTAHEREHIGTAPDALQGLDYMHARYYSNRLGRFTGIDPAAVEVGRSQPWNRYAYVEGSPVVFLDPTGADRREAIKRILRNPRFRAVASAGASCVAETASRKLPPGKARGTALLAASVLAADSAAAAAAVSATSFIAAFGSVETGVGPVGGTVTGLAAAGLAIYDFKVGTEYLSRAVENIQHGTDSGDGLVQVEALRQYEGPIVVKTLDDFETSSEGEVVETPRVLPDDPPFPKEDDGLRQGRHSWL